jgi:hypothetical protein
MTETKEYFLVLLNRIFSQKNKPIGEIYNLIDKTIKECTLKKLSKVSDLEYVTILESINDDIIEDDIEIIFDDELLNEE